MFDPQIGQFLSDDPIGFDGGDVNLRRYAGNNPINEVDPSGLQALPVIHTLDEFDTQYAGGKRVSELSGLVKVPGGNYVSVSVYHSVEQRTPKGGLSYSAEEDKIMFMASFSMIGDCPKCHWLQFVRTYEVVDGETREGLPTFASGKWIKPNQGHVDVGREDKVAYYDPGGEHIRTDRKLAILDKPTFIPGGKNVKQVKEFNTFLVCNKAVVYGARWLRTRFTDSRGRPKAPLYEGFERLDITQLPDYLAQDEFVVGYESSNLKQVITIDNPLLD